MPVAAIREFLKLESAGGICLFFAAVVAIILDNSALAQLYDSFLTVPVAVQVDALEIAKPLLLWINDGLMAVFFFLVGLEIKREALEGQLLSVNQIGVFGMAWLTIKTGLARMPEGANWSMIYGVSLLCGIGFTMSLFVGGLAFDDTGHAAAVRLGVLAGSITSGIAGYLVLKRAIARKA